MARKTIGYSELEWICPNCNTRNPGTLKNCSSCGSPQPEDVVFVAAMQQEILEDEDKILAAKAGADIHCGFCGTRNPAVAKTCSQCGADLTAGIRRITGSVVGAFKTENGAVNWICENCQFENPSENHYCRQCGSPNIQKEPVVSAPAKEFVTEMESQITNKRNGKRNVPLIVLGMVVIVSIFIFLIAVLTRTKDLIGEVSGVYWERSIRIESFVTVNREAWQDQVPSEGRIENCELRFYNEQDQPAAQSTEVCGTPYMLDLGNGNAEVVQDCSYRVYEPYCSYAIDTWQASDQIESSGQDLSPIWPQADLSSDQRIGNQSESFQINFETPDGSYQFDTNDIGLFEACQPGSRWELTLNAFNRVTAIQPLD